MINIIQAPNANSFSKNAIPLWLESSYGYGATFELVISVEMDFVGSGNWRQIGFQRLYADLYGRAEIDLCTIYDTAFTEFVKPSLSAIGISSMVDKIWKAQYEIQELYLGTPDDYIVDTFDLWRGGIPRQYEKTVDTVNWLLTNKKWFTWKPSPCLISKRQPEYLFLKTPLAGLPAHGGITGFDVTFEVYCASGLAFTKTVVQSITGIPQFDIYFVPVGFDANALQTLIGPGESALYYDVTAYEHSTSIILGEKRRYIIDQIERPFERFFMFTNSLGGFDTLRTIGEAVPKVVSTDTESDNFRSVDIATNQPPVQRLDAVEEFSRVINTGYWTRETTDWLRDFRLALDVHELETENMEVLQPISFVSKELKPSKDNQDLHALVFEYKCRYENSTFASQPLHD